MEQNQPNKKNIFQILFSIFWIIFVGILSTIEYFIMGLALCITILGIPLGIACFKAIPLVFNPVGKVVVRHYGSHPILNTLFLIFAGLVLYIATSLLCLVLYITIIGIPFATQLLKIRDYFLAPFGAEIIEYGQYSKSRNNIYDIRLLQDRIRNTNNEKIKIDDEMIDPIEYLKKSSNNKAHNFYVANCVSTGICVLLMFVIFGSIAKNQTPIYIVIAIIMIIILFIINVMIIDYMEQKFMGDSYKALTYYYGPNKSKGKKMTRSQFNKELYVKKSL